MSAPPPPSSLSLSPSRSPSPAIDIAADHALRLCFAADRDPVDDAGQVRLTFRIRQVMAHVLDDPPPGLTDVAAGYRSLLLRFLPATFDAHACAEGLSRRLQTLPPADSIASHPPPRCHAIPVWYGRDLGPDLSDVARHVGLSEADVIALHASAVYTVAFLGFAPGFPYLLGLPPALHIPRLSSPRPRVPAGSVAIAGAQAGIYPQRSPGGWRLLGRTNQPLLQLASTPQSLLWPGDEVRFVPQPASEYREPSSPYDPLDPQISPIAGAVPGLRVLSPGPLSTVQDLGRPGWAHLGISAGGAADAVALRVANRLVGNPDGAAGLELTLRGPELQAEIDLCVAVLGSLDVAIDGVTAPTGQTLQLRAGQVLRCGVIRSGVRAYLAVAGGLCVPSIAGSMSTDLRGGFGGLAGRALATGDRLWLPDRARQIVEQPAPALALSPQGLDLLRPQTTLRVTWGLQADWFAPSLRRRLPDVSLTVGAQSNRTGLRLQADPPWTDSDGAQALGTLHTEGVCAGAVQVPPDGQPILLGVEQQATGGYPKLAQVIAADLPLLGRLRPGDRIALQPVDWLQARAAYGTLQAQLAQATLPRPVPHSARSR